MKITAIAAGLSLVAGLVAAAPAVAQGHAYGHYKHGDRYEDEGRYGRSRHADRGEYRERDYRTGYARPHGYARPYGDRPYGYGNHHSRVVCRYRFGERRCFRA